ncbi:hypothetical protein PLICRDRAFT_697580 [Plicaturopsis crispa FD-325 SS-3]|nr:hypothetical protein PLICRDRAFT_697580 [Plicaturopsis crispa FD-325 SS-3]
MTVNDFGAENPIDQRPIETRLIALQNRDPEYMKVQKDFLRGWKHPGKQPKPAVHAVFKIVASYANMEAYLQYRDLVETSPSLKRSPSLSPGNECLLFHGTSRACLLGDSIDNIRPCALTECFLCCIIRNSFDIEKCGSKHKFRRFGNGIYTTSCSSKADDYLEDLAKTPRFRVLLVNRVVVGNTFKQRKNAVNLTEPPSGYHSVLGEPGEDLNYEETVVYDNAAIRPAYVVVYGTPPASDSKFKALVQALFSTPLAS